ncbi:YdcF family protein [Micromonospora sp. NBC_01699]|uniref:SanA/YdcF family protein n=1 Tax=Micromonospora sp. NBC_01699 TaxID=2975984 RepID=UPI002E36A49E|nr:ElyC/SanA/YdcF family protein [Micromonospora sp. NBC_01699]
MSPVEGRSRWVLRPVSVVVLLRRWWRRLLVAAVAVVLLGLSSVVGSAIWVDRSSRAHVFDLAGVPAAPVVLVLGAQVAADGTPAPFLAARLQLAKELYDAGKARVVLVSGDHRRYEYDEPGAMRRWLVDRGVPASRVVQDHAGFDTYDSCLRASRVFGVRQVIVVTQGFHVERAVAVCRQVGLDAVGVGDDSVSRFGRAWRWGSFRERFAAVKAVYDVVSRRDPVFLGPRESSVDDALRG